MTIIEQLARWLAAKLNLPVEDTAAGGAVFWGYLPEAPARAVCVYAEELRPEGDTDGTRVQIVVRSGADGAWPLETALAIVRLLNDRRDVLFVRDGAYISRVETERGFEFAGMSEGNTQQYAGYFRVYDCGGEAL